LYCLYKERISSVKSSQTEEGINENLGKA